MAGVLAKGIPMDEVKGWQNRIVGYGEESPDQLLANPHNHRIHPKRQQDALSGSLETLGVIQTVIVNKATGHIVDGHLRVTMALREGQTSIPVTYVELTEAEEAQALLSLDPIAAMAANDRDKVDELLRMVNTDNEQVMKHLADFASENKLNYGQSEQVDAEPQVDRAAELQEKWRTATGQLWKLGEHRLLIGDCTVRENVERLMGGERASMCFTSPPYNAGKTATEKDADKASKYNGDLDNKDGFDYLGLLRDFTNNALLFCEYAFVNIQVIAGNKAAFIQYWYENADKFADVAIWDKKTAQPAAAHKVMDSRFEFVLIFGGNGSRAIGTRDFRGMVHNVYEGSPQRHNKNADIHAATMPIDLPEHFIKTFTNDGELIYEPFCGTGTTIIAAHNLKRRCYAMEISEKYSAVILERFQTATGITPELIK